MRVFVWATVASAAAFEGVLFGQPFEAAAALGLADPKQPGVLSVLVVPQPLSCDEARAWRDGGAGKKKKKKKKSPPVVVVAFADVRAGATASTVLAMSSEGLAALEGTVTLTAVPSAVGQTGTLALALAAQAGAKEGAFGAMVASEAGDRLEGEVPFELCDALAVRPSLAGTAFEPTSYRVVSSSFGDSPPDELDLVVSLPKDWTAGKGPFGEPQWTAPDGVTKLTLDLSSPSSDLAASTASWADSQVQGFQTPSTQGELLASRLAADGAYVVRWRYRSGTGPWTNRLEVFRQGDGWPHAVKCRLEGSDTALAEVFDAAEQACTTLTVPGTP